MKIGWVAPVKPSHPYLENDPAPLFDLHYLRISPWLWFRRRRLQTRIGTSWYWPWATAVTPLGCSPSPPPLQQAVELLEILAGTFQSYPSSKGEWLTHPFASDLALGDALNLDWRVL